MLIQVRIRHKRPVPFSISKNYATNPTSAHHDSYLSNAKHDIFWWNTCITNCFRNGQIDDACKYFNQMPYKNVVTWNCIVTGYIQNNMILTAQKVFDIMPEKNIVSWAALMTGYAKCGRVDEARNLFDKIPDKNVVCWNSMISAYIKHNKIGEARKLFDLMPTRNAVSLSVMILGYVKQKRIDEARKLFDKTCLRSTYLCNALLSGYVELGYVKDAEELFSLMVEKDVISWNCMITCYSQAKKMELARDLFDKMHFKDTISWTAIINGYLKNGNIEDAYALFNKMPSRDVMAWNTMMGGFVSNDYLEDALRLFREMPERDIVSYNTILQGYVQKGDMSNALKWFEKIPQKSETSWNTLITAYRSEEALNLFCKMVSEKFKPNRSTLAVVISVSASLVALNWGKMVHLFVIREGYERDTQVLSSLISMYSRCGLIKDSSSVFDSMLKRDTISWNAMIGTYAYHGYATKAFQLFNEMVDNGFYPDQVTFLSILLACSHKGLIDEGYQYFKSMKKDYGLVPKAGHYSCMIDLLGRSGFINEAYEFIDEIPVEIQANAWETLLSACRFHGELDIGEISARKVLHAQPTDGAMYIILSNIYAAKEKWDEAAKVRALMRARGLKKEKGTSWIEIKGKMFSFLCNDNSPLVEEICRELDNISLIMEDTI